MKKTNIANLRNNLSTLLDEVIQGCEVEIQRRNETIARLVPVKLCSENRTQLGLGKGTVKFLDDVLKPAFSDDDWDMHK